MVIQRIQTLMLLIAIAMMAVFCFTPYATLMADSVPTAVYVKDAPVFLTLNIVIAVLLFLIIFMYKDLRRQIRMTVLALLLICASIVTCGFILVVGLEDATPVLLGGVSLLVLALLFGLLALRGMRHDRRLLAGADRLR